MCYTATISFSKKARIAKKDIKVFKYAFKYGNIVRPYFSDKYLIYKEGKEYTSKIGKMIIDNKIKIFEGLHSFNKKLCWGVRKGNYFEIHSLLLQPTTIFNYGTFLVKMECHIPKGATYYINLSGEMVSDRLVIDKITNI